MKDLEIAIQKHSCPSCGEVGSMVILKTSARIKCEKCNATNLDPFAVGPSSHKIRIRDTYKGHEVSFFAIKKTEEIPDLELNTNRLEFEKWIRLQKS